MADASPRTPRILKQTRCDSLRRLIMLICYVWSPFKSSQMHQNREKLQFILIKNGRNLNCKRLLQLGCTSMNPLWRHIFTAAFPQIYPACKSKRVAVRYSCLFHLLFHRLSSVLWNEILKKKLDNHIKIV